MEIALTLSDIGWICLFIIAAAAGVYLVLALANAHRLLKQVNRILADNRTNIDTLLENAQAISTDTRQTTQRARETAEDAEEVYRNIKTGLADTLSTFTETARKTRFKRPLVSEVLGILIQILSHYTPRK
jgi:ABC-type transporter Mla subunit MlaD